MENNNAKMIDALNSLIIINHDRTVGYDRAAEESKDTDLDLQFYENAIRSKGYATKLSQFVRELGGDPAEGTTNSGKLYRVWMDVKAAIITKDRVAILSSCEYGEDVALKTYEEFRENKEINMPADYITTIMQQETEIRSAHDRIKQMRDREKEMAK